MFMSKTFGGRSTDGQIVNQSKFPRVLEPEDKVLSDKGPFIYYVSMCLAFLDSTHLISRRQLLSYPS